MTEDELIEDSKRILNSMRRDRPRHERKQPLYRPWSDQEQQEVAIYAEGKENALAVGYMKMTTDKMKETGKGIAVENLHYLIDGLWSTKTID